MVPENPPLSLSPDFEYALDRMEGAGPGCLFITGRAGTGKSTLLQLFRRTTRKKVVVLAPTGVAALNVGGQTIHSFFGFPPRLIDPRTDIKKKRFRQLYQCLDAIVIDEISMVRADMIDAIDQFLRVNRESDRPFGGLSVLFFGDLFQLPPVVANDVERHFFGTVYESPYFFSARVFRQGYSMEVISLEKVYRQESRHFLRLLECIRRNHIDEDVIMDLNTRCLPHFSPGDESYITLSARNARVDDINNRALDDLPYPTRTYTASIKGDFPANLYPAEAALRLKQEAQVMLLRNDPEKRYVNGTIGKVTALGEDSITVVVEDNRETRTLEIGRQEWEVLRYKVSEGSPDTIETETLGSFIQFPLRLAWAVTIHKAQGKTFDKAIIDLGRGAFEHGQTYVALSRCRSLEGIVLRQPLRPNDVLVDERIVDFYESIR
jgi:ATP-dependent DNA helicase PIF1